VLLLVAVSSYRDLLDRWQLWKERARFDVARGPFIDMKPPPQVHHFSLYFSFIHLFPLDFFYVV
jgi:hypothetical protein